MPSLNTPKSERDSQFYADQFTDETNWGPGEFEKFCQVIGFTEPDADNFFGHRASQAWEAMTDQQKADFSRDFDDWLDA